MGPTQSFLTEQEVIDKSFKLGANVYASGFRPSFIVGLWRGGSAVGIYVQESLQTLGVVSNHIAIRTSYQGAPDYARQLHSATPDIQVHGTQYLLDTLSADDRLLIVDDVFDTGRSVAAVIEELRRRARKNTPTDIRIAVPYHKPARNETDRQPDYVLYETSEWLKYPHSLEGLSRDEIRQHRPNLGRIIDEARQEQ